jgi:hypothetical protein
MGKVLFNTLLFISRGYPTKDTRRWVKMTAPPKIDDFPFPTIQYYAYIYIYMYIIGETYGLGQCTHGRNLSKP